MAWLRWPAQFAEMVSKLVGDISSQEEFRREALRVAVDSIKQRISQQIPCAINPPGPAKVFFARLDLPDGVEYSGMFELDGIKGRMVQIYDPVNDAMTVRVDVLVVPLDFMLSPPSNPIEAA